jgi:ADP-heptose:LPS heptosyltransferase
LLARTPGIDAAVAQGQPPAQWDLQAPLVSLPGVFGTTLETIPAEVPYVFPNVELAGRWRQELAADARLKVGMAWRGNPRHPGDRFRSIKLAEFDTLLSNWLRLYSLQKDATDDERGQLADRLGAVDLSSRLDDFDATAAVVANLDLVITCDSSVAHLAAAMGVRVWVALPFAPDWRWLLEREDSPWYPSLRLFRQPQPGDWADVFRRMRAALDELPDSRPRESHQLP